MSDPTPLNDAQIAEALSKLHDWKTSGKSLEKTFDCKDFKGSIHFVNAVANIANHVDHHPDITISWNKVSIVLTTHDGPGGITARDVDLAARLDAVGD